MRIDHQARAPVPFESNLTPFSCEELLELDLRLVARVVDLPLVCPSTRSASIARPLRAEETSSIELGCLDLRDQLRCRSTFWPRPPRNSVCEAR